jgi:Domain of unknown function (DUF4177)
MKWEYEVVEIVTTARHFTVRDVLNMTGREGWELVTVLHKARVESGAEWSQAIFKRPSKDSN